MFCICFLQPMNLGAASFYTKNFLSLLDQGLAPSPSIQSIMNFLVCFFLGFRKVERFHHMITYTVILSRPFS